MKLKIFIKAWMTGSFLMLMLPYDDDDGIHNTDYEYQLEYQLLLLHTIVIKTNIFSTATLLLLCFGTFLTQKQTLKQRKIKEDCY